MNVIVNSDVWSEAFRRGSSKSVYVEELYELISETRIELLGAIRQEILSGIRSAKVFERIDRSLSVFDNRLIETEVYSVAAKFFNLCRSKGIQGSNTDFLICSCAVSWGYPILTKDQDFFHYQKLIPIELLAPRNSLSNNNFDRV